LKGFETLRKPISSAYLYYFRRVISAQMFGPEFLRDLSVVPCFYSANISEVPGWHISLLSK